MVFTNSKTADRKETLAAYIFYLKKNRGSFLQKTDLRDTDLKF